MGKNNFIFQIKKNVFNSNKKKILHFLSNDLEIQSSLTYAEIDIKARTVAAFLQAKGIRPGNRAILLYPPGLDFIVSFVACLYSGVIAVPMYPPFTPFLLERLEAVIGNAEPSIILSTHKIISGLKIQQWMQSLNKLPWIKKLSKFSVWPSETLQRDSSFLWENTDKLTSFSSEKYQSYDACEEEVAFLQYTSGSTGNPKGVMISYGNLASNAEIIESRLHVNKHTVAFCWVPPYHDLGLIGNILQALYTNCSLYLLSPFDFIKDPLIWVKGISRYRATHSSAPNFAFALTCSHSNEIDTTTLDLSSWQVAHCGGEPIQAKVLDQFSRVFAPVKFNPSALYPCYGMAEATLYISGHKYQGKEKHAIYVEKQAIKNNQITVTQEDSSSSYPLVSCGKPALELRIVDPNTLQILPENKIGEIWIAGPSVAKGYWKNQRETEENFKLKLDQTQDVDYFRTGDLGFLRNNQLYITGRLKDLIIIHGCNYYPQDIEYAVEQSHELVKPGRVVALEINHSGTTGIGLIVGIRKNKLKKKEKEHLIKTIYLDFLKRHNLPILKILLVPAYSVLKTTSGKLRRKAMKVALENKTLQILGEFSNAFQDNSRKIRNTSRTVQFAENQYIAILQEILRHDQISPSDHFLELGGDSIKAAQFIARVNEKCKNDVPIDIVLESRNIGELIKNLENFEKIEKIEKIKPFISTSHGNRVPASDAQQRIWFVEQLHSGKGLYNIAAAIRLHGNLIHAAIKYAVHKLINRHAILRTVFQYQNGTIYQIIKEELVNPIEYNTLFSLSKQKREDRLHEYISKQAMKKFNLKEGPLFEIKLIRYGFKDYMLCFVIHHIICDGWSIGILMKDFTFFYNHFFSDQIRASLPPALQYTDYVMWKLNIFKKDDFNRKLNYWIDELKDSPELLHFPINFSRSKEGSFQAATLFLPLSIEESQGIIHFAQKNKVTPYVILLSVFYILLNRYSGNQDIVVGTTSANRLKKETENIVGFFANTLAVRVKLHDEMTIEELIQVINTKIINAFKNEEISFEKIIEYLPISRELSYHPLFQVVFNYLENKTDELSDLKGLSVSLVEPQHVITQYDFTLNITHIENQFKLKLEYNTHLFSRQFASQIIKHYVFLLSKIFNVLDKQISQIQLLTPKEYQQITIDWNNIKRDHANGTTLVSLFEDQVKKNPSKVALLFENEIMTYDELNKKSNKLAHFLQSQGVGADVIVSLCMQPSFEMVISILAILKAGGSYQPIDTENSLNRTELIMKNSHSPFILVRGKEKVTKLAGLSVPVIDILSIQDSSHEDNLKQVVHPHDLAYVIHTSGSTGIPKGVLVEHQSVLNTLAWMKSEFSIQPSDVFLQKMSCCFDASVWEFFCPLIYGASMVIARSDVNLDPEYLLSLIEEKKITILNFVPSMLQIFIFYLENLNRNIDLKSLRTILCGGEPFKKSLAVTFNKKQYKHIQIYNLYGPTETSIIASFYKLNSKYKAHSILPIGYPIDNVTLYIVDKFFNLVPIGVPGELIIGGAGLARGYLDPLHTEANFIQIQIKKSRIERFYRTGDLCRWLADGKIEYIGRRDHQVKVRGFRIELGEIEKCLLENSAVREAVVTTDTHPKLGTNLIAYIVPFNKKDVESVRKSICIDLDQKLSPYMIPNQIIFLKKIPITISGKLDRKSLDDFLIDHSNSREYDYKISPFEKILCELWKEVLGIKHIGVNDDFFSIGGSSLSALMLIDQMNKKLGTHYKVHDLFKYRNIKKIASIDTHHILIQEPKNLNNENSRVVINESIMKFFLWLLRIKKLIIKGQGHIPNKGGFILAMNHGKFSYKIVTFFYILSILNNNKQKPVLLTIKAIKIFDVILRNYFHCVYLNRNYNDVDIKLLNNTVEYLKQDGVVFISLEGKQNRGKLRRAKEGVAYLASYSNSVVLPMAIYKGKSKKAIIVKIESPIIPDSSKRNITYFIELTNQIMGKISTMLPKK